MVLPHPPETFFFFFLFFFHAGSFYFNDISCYDADHCVAVGEGDGAVEPGNRIYATKNGGATWELTHRDATPSMGCMGVRMVSPTDVMAGCYNTVSQFKITALFLTSKDGGYTWTQDAVPPPHGAVITDLDAVSMTAGFATAITSEEQSAIYKLSLIAPTMPPTPPPHPNRPGQTHYGNPFDGACETGERNISITGVPGAVCAPICTGLLKNKCSTDLPPGVTATPQCDISDSTYSDKLCALMCDVGAGQVRDCTLTYVFLSPYPGCALTSLSLSLFFLCLSLFSAATTQRRKSTRGPAQNAGRFKVREFARMGLRLPRWKTRRLFRS